MSKTQNLVLNSKDTHAPTQGVLLYYIIPLQNLYHFRVSSHFEHIL